MPSLQLLSLAAPFGPEGAWTSGVVQRKQVDEIVELGGAPLTACTPEEYLELGVKG